MTLQFEPDAETGGEAPSRRRWMAGLAAAMLVAAAGGLGFGLGYAIGDDQPDRVSDPTGDAGEDDTSTTIADEPPSTDASTAPAGTEPATSETAVDGDEPATTDPAGSEHVAGDEAQVEPDVIVSDTALEPGHMIPNLFAPMEVRYERTTDAGLVVRVQLGPEWDVGLPWSVAGWVQPGWCQPVRAMRVTVDGDGIVDVGSSEWFDELYEGRAVRLLLLGAADGAPHRVLVLQVDPGVSEVAVEFDDGGSDRAAVVDGVAVLVVPGLGGDPDTGTGDPWLFTQMLNFDLTLVGEGGSTTLARSEVGTWDNPDFAASCEPPPPALPDPGEQPADPAAAEQEIRTTMTALYGGDSDEDDDELVDDPTGVADAREQVAETGFEAEAASAVAVVEELVFTAPDEAWFRYRIETSGFDLTDRYGTAVVVDGTWRITRGTVCQDLAVAGGDCGDFEPVQLPRTGS